MQKIVVYQVLTRLFGNKTTDQVPNGTLKENGSGKFDDINRKALDELKNLGVSHVWYTGVLEHASTTPNEEFGMPADPAPLVKGKAGSPYAVKDYYDVSPDLANKIPDRMQEFEHLVQRTREAGLKTLIDFIPNHLSRIYTSDAKPPGTEDFGASDDTTTAFSAQNNFYYLLQEQLILPDDDPKHPTYSEYPAKATGSDAFHPHPSKQDWYETIKLNYGLNYFEGKSEHFDPIPKTWLMMRDVLMYWASKGVDGFRCDMAEMVPVEFWNWVTYELKKAYPHLLFIAEVYDPSAYEDFIFKGGFDYLYDKVGLYDTLRGLIEGHGSANDITHCWKQQQGISDFMFRFLENHDEQRVASSYFAIDSFAAIPAMVVSATLHNGPVMIYFGQEVGEPAIGAQGFSENNGRTSIFDYCGVPEHQKWMNDGAFDGGLLAPWQLLLRVHYEKLLQLSGKNEAFYKGEFYDLQYLNYGPHYPSHKVFSYVRHTADQKMLIICNFDRETNFEINLRISEAAFEAVGLSTLIPFSAKELFWGNQADIDLSPPTIWSNGIPLSLPPKSALIYEIQT